MNGTGKIPRIIECSKCGCEWNVSSKATIPNSGYVCPHCTSRERNNNIFQEGEHMANRALIKKNKVEDFKGWLQEDGWQIEQPKGMYEVVRARKEGRRPLIVYSRDNKGNEHICVQRRDEGIVRAYIRDRKREARARANGIQKLTSEEMARVIDTREPRGLFYRIEGRTIIGVDNTTGNAWTEDFRDFETFMLWITTQLSVEEAERITGRRINHGKGNSIRNQKSTRKEAQ